MNCFVGMSGGIMLQTSGVIANVSLTVWSTVSSSTTGFVANAAGTVLASEGNSTSFYAVSGFAALPDAVSKARARYWRRLVKHDLRKRRQAEQKASKLFVDLFGARTLERFRREKEIKVRAASGQEYVVPLKGRVLIRDTEGNERSNFCVVPDGSVPSMDAIIMRILLLRSGHEGERLFLEKANRFNFNIAS